MEPIVDDLADMFADVVGVQTVSAGGGLEDPSLGTLIYRSARVSGQITLVRDVTGQEKVSRVMAIFAGDFGLTVDHYYTLPLRFIPANPPAIAVHSHTDENGAHHQTVYF